MRFQQCWLCKILTLTDLCCTYATNAAFRCVRAPRCDQRADDEAARRHHDPAAVLTLDALDPPKPGRDRARLDLDDAIAALDQRGAVIDAAKHPARHDGRLQRAGGVDASTCGGGVCGRDAIEPVTSAAAAAARPRGRRGGSRCGGRGLALLGLRPSRRDRASRRACRSGCSARVLDGSRLVFNAARLSLSDFVVARSCATVSFRRLDSSATLSFGRPARPRPGGRRGKHRPELGDAERSATAPKLAAIATQAASSAKRAGDCGGLRDLVSGAELLLGLARLDAGRGAAARASSCRIDLCGVGLRSGSGRFRARHLRFAFGSFSTARLRIFAAARLGSSRCFAVGANRRRRGQRQLRLFLGCLIAGHGIGSNGENSSIGNFQTLTDGYRIVAGSSPHDARFRVNFAGTRYPFAPLRWSKPDRGRAGSSRRRRAAAAWS